VKEGTFGRGAPRGNPSARTQLFAADRRTSHGSKKDETLRCQMEVPKKTRKSECCPQADVGQGARGAHSGESCTGTDVNTGVAVAQKTAVTWWDTSGWPEPGEAYYAETERNTI